MDSGDVVASYIYCECISPAETASGNDTQPPRRAAVFDLLVRGSSCVEPRATDDCTRMRLMIMVALHSNDAAATGLPPSMQR